MAWGHGEEGALHVRCEVCEKKPAATILEGHYLCGGCALRSLEEVSDVRAGTPRIDLSEQPEGEPWRLPKPKKGQKQADPD